MVGVMSDVIVLRGELIKPVPNPMSTHDPSTAWIGSVLVSYPGDDKTAAILRVATGRLSGDTKWGQYTLILHWIGDPPPVEIAQAVYDLVLDGGPTPRTIDSRISAQHKNSSQHSYFCSRAST